MCMTGMCAGRCSSQMQNSDFSWDDASASDSGEERVYLVGVEQTRHGKGSSKVMYSVEESLDELAKLADTAGLQVRCHKSGVCSTNRHLLMRPCEMLSFPA